LWPPQIKNQTAFRADWVVSILNIVRHLPSFSAAVIWESACSIEFKFIFHPRMDFLGSLVSVDLCHAKAMSKRSFASLNTLSNSRSLGRVFHWARGIHLSERWQFSFEHAALSGLTNPIFTSALLEGLSAFDPHSGHAFNSGFSSLMVL
jgi:hypothetical protein